MVSISPFGDSDTGPYRQYVDSELVVLALGGLLNMVGSPDREPVRLGGYQSEYQAGTAAFTGLLAALHSRDLDGLGQRVEIAAQETVAFTEWKSAIYYQATGQLRQRGGVLSQWVVLPCSDGFAAFVYQDGDWPRVVTLIQDERLADDRFLTRRGRLTFADELRGYLQAWTCQRTKLEVYHTAQANGVPVGMVADMADVLDSPQYRDRQFFDRIDHPSTGIAEYPGLPVRFNGERPRTTRAPLLGEHNRAVYERRLGFDEQTVTRLRERGII